MPAPVEHQICPAVCVLMKLSFDEEHRHAMNELGKTEACLGATCTSGFYVLVESVGNEGFLLVNREIRLLMCVTTLSI